MKEFFKFMFASCLGSFLMFFVLIFILLGIAGVMVAKLVGSDAQNQVVHSSSVLHLELDRPIVERSFNEIDMLLSSETSYGLNTLLQSIKEASSDERIKGIYLKTGISFDAGWATIEDIRTALKGFREKGKFVYAYSDSYTQKAYYLATASDSIFMNPSGSMYFQGIGADVFFVKDLLSKLDVEVDLLRPKSNAFKSAGEMFLLNKMSESNREQVRSYIQSVWKHVVEQISSERKIPAAKLQEIADQLTAYKPELAQKAGMLDRLLFESEVLECLVRETGAVSIKKLKQISFTRYMRFIMPEQHKDKVALIYAFGDVKTGAGNTRDVYSENIMNSFYDALADKDVKAIVLRVNSPGGHVLGSELMTDVVRSAAKKKPVIVSMGDVAASAGYEISCYANRILAQPTTLTGSIGVFALVPNVGKALKNKLGIHIDTVGTNANSNSMTVLRPLSPQAHKVMEEGIEDFYKVFCGRVAEGRKLSVDSVDKIARGRVWTGAQAIEIGLVDELGGLERAFVIAAQSANIQKYSVVEYPAQKDSFTQILESMQAKIQMKVFGKNTEKFQSYLQDLEKISDMEGMQARLPFFLQTY